jgi:6-pyruvoyl-tetrahydropterin synthase
MLYARNFKSQFDAGHLTLGVPGHDRPHGHTFEVEVGIEGPLLAEEGGISRVARSDGIQERLNDICFELDGRDLDAMMPGSFPVPEVIAAWFLERLPDADFVQITMGWRKEVGWARRTKR